MLIRFPQLFAMALAASLALGACSAWSQALPPIPKAAQGKGKGLPAAPAPAPVEPPFISPGPKDLPKAASACSELPEKGTDWVKEALGALQAQSLRPGGVPKARDAYAELWLFFKSSRAKGYDMDSYGSKVEALYKSLYPAGAFAPESPFERFKEPRRMCSKKFAPEPAPAQ